MWSKIAQRGYESVKYNHADAELPANRARDSLAEAELR
jgi:hypothetical protein